MVARARKLPGADVVRRVIAEEAFSHGVSETHVIGRSRRKKAEAARRRAINRIMRETGCSERGLAKVWGISTGTVRRAIRSELVGEHAVVFARLSWCYGEQRAKAIILGQDKETAKDLAAWKRLGNNFSGDSAPPSLNEVTNQWSVAS